MRLLSQVLTDLIGYAENLMTRPRYAQPRGTDFGLIAAEIRHAETLPAEGQRTTRAAIVMVTAIEAYRANEGEAASPWLMIAGAALPLLRTEAWLAFNQEKEGRGR
jgi:hypothetical protein